MQEPRDFRGVFFRNIFIGTGNDVAEHIVQRRLRRIMRGQPRFRKREGERPFRQGMWSQAGIGRGMKRRGKKKQGTPPKRSQKCSARKFVVCRYVRPHPGVLAEVAMLAQVFAKLQISFPVKFMNAWQDAVFAKEASQLVAQRLDTGQVKALKRGIAKRASLQ